MTIDLDDRASHAALPADALAQDCAEHLSQFPTDALAMRNKLYLPFLAEGKLNEAAIVLEALVSHDPRRALFWRDMASLALKMRDNVSAAKAIEAAMVLEPLDRDTLAQGLQVLLAAGENSRAAALAEKSQEILVDHPRLLHLSMLAHYRSGDGARAADAALALIASTPLDIEMVAIAAAVLNSHGKVHAARDALEAADVDQCGYTMALFEYGRSLFLIDSTDPRAREFLGEAMRLDPGNLRTISFAARAAAEAGDPRGAAELLERIPPEKRREAVWAELAEQLVKGPDPERGIAILERLVQNDPQNRALRRSYTGALVRAGRADEARAQYGAWLSERSAALPDRFADGVAAIEADPGEAGIPAHRMDWIWDVLVREGRAPADRQAWEKQLKVVNRIDTYLLDWLESRRDRFEELLPFFESNDAARAAVQEARERGKGVFIASPHIGVLFGGAMSLYLSGEPYTWLASIPDLQDGEDETFISASTDDEGTIGRKILRALRDNRVMSIACDGASVSRKTSYPFFDRQVRISDFIPRLAHRLGTPSFFPFVTWTGGKVRSELRPLPLPLEGEDADAYTARWMTAFLSCMQEFFVNHPGDLRAAGGFWTVLRD